MRPAVLVSALATAGGAALAAAAPPTAPVPPAPALVTPGADPSTPAFSIGPLDSYIGAADYPREALRRGEAGMVWFRLLVDETGRGRGCSVTASSGHPALDTAACRLILARARFRPGRDAAGRPVASLTQGVYVWRLPGWERARPAGPPLPIPAPPPPPPPPPPVR